MTVTEVCLEGLPRKAQSRVRDSAKRDNVHFQPNALHLSPREESRGMHMTVDHFMRGARGTKGKSWHRRHFVGFGLRMGPWEWPRFKPTAA